MGFVRYAFISPPKDVCGEAMGVGNTIGSSKLGLTSECAGYFIADLLSACYAMLMGYNNSEKAVHGYNSALCDTWASCTAGNEADTGLN